MNSDWRGITREDIKRLKEMANSDFLKGMVIIEVDDCINEYAISFTDAEKFEIYNSCFSLYFINSTELLTDIVEEEIETRVELKRRDENE